MYVHIYIYIYREREGERERERERYIAARLSAGLSACYLHGVLHLRE